MNCSVPVVSVSSVYVPSLAAVQLPLTWSDPVISADVQPAPTTEGSSVPLTVRHDDVTVQVPTKLPPQAVTFEHEAPEPPLPEAPPAPIAPPPPVPNEGPESERQADEVSPGPKSVANVKSAK